MKPLIITTSILFLAAGLFISQAAYSQEEKKEEKKIHIKIITLKDGKEVKIDTTFIGEDFDDEAFRNELKEKYGIEVEDLEFSEGVKVKLDRDKTGAVGVALQDEAKKVIIIKEMDKGDEKDLEFIWDAEMEGNDTTDRVKMMYFITEDGDKFTIKEGAGDEKVIYITTDEGGKKVIKEGDSRKMIWVTEEGETKVIKGEGTEKVIILKTGEDCGKDKKARKVKEETIRVIVITDDEDDE